MARHVTIKDVAERAGVSPSTVSFVLNNTSNQTISEPTRNKIHACVKELGYVANFQASNMAKRKSRSNTIGVVMSCKLHHIYSHDIVCGLSDQAGTLGYGLLLCGVNKSVSKDSLFVRYFLEGRIDGIILVSSAHSEEDSMENDFIDIFHAYNIPFIVLYGYSNRPDVSYINIDMKQCGRDATQLLINQGLERLVYIGVLDKTNQEPYLPQTEKDRIDGYKAVVKNPKVLFLSRDFGDMDENVIEDEIKKLGLIDGFVTCWATIGIQLSAWIKATGRCANAKIIALENLPFMEYTHRDILSMRLPFYELSKLGVETFIQKLQKSGEANETIYCKCHLYRSEFDSISFAGQPMPPS